MKTATHGRWNRASQRDCRSAGSRILRSKWPSRRKALDSKPLPAPLELRLLKWHPLQHQRLQRRFPHRPSLPLRHSPLPPSPNTDHRRRLKRRSPLFPIGRNRNPLRLRPRQFPKCSSRPPLLRSLLPRRSHPLSAPRPNKLPRLPHRLFRSMVRSRTRLPSASSNCVRSSAWTAR